MTELDAVGALIIRPGDHLILCCARPITYGEADRMRQGVMENLPQLADVTILCADAIAVYRDEPPQERPDHTDWSKGN